MADDELAAFRSGPLPSVITLVPSYREERRQVERRKVWRSEHLVAVTSFERKRYVNLSHEPNKAMNRNTYLDLLGRPIAFGAATLYRYGSWF